MNYKKMNRGDLNCIFQCIKPETQVHIFEDCQPIRNMLSFPSDKKIKAIFGTMSQQKEAISTLIQNDVVRKQMKIDTLNGL